MLTTDTKSQYFVTPGGAEMSLLVDSEAGEAEGGTSLPVCFCRCRRELPPILTVFHASGLVVDSTAGLFTVVMSDKCWPSRASPSAQVICGCGEIEGLIYCAWTLTTY